MSFPLVVFFLLYHIYTVKSIFLSISGKLINASFLCSRRYNFLPRGEVILCFRHSDFSLGRRSENCLINRARYVTINTRERGVNCSFGVLKLVGMWLAKVARRGEISNAISKNFVGYCVGCEDL